MPQRERMWQAARHGPRTIAHWPVATPATEFSRILLRSAAWLVATLLAATALLAEEKTDNAATRDYAVAVGFQNKQLYPQAVARWQKFIEAYPNDPRRDRAYYHLGACQLKSGEADKAAATFRLVLANYPNFASRDAAQFNLAMALYQIGLKANQPPPLKTAAEAFAQVIAAYPQSKQVPAALFYQGESLYAAGERGRAVELYQQLLAQHAQSDLAPDARYALGTAQHELGQPDAAEKTWQAFLAAHAQDPRANECKLRLGLAQLAAKKYAEAGQTLGQVAAIADFPLADLALLRQAECHARQNQTDQALALYRALPERFPASAHGREARVAAGKLLYQAGKYAEAEQTLTPAAAPPPVASGNSDQNAKQTDAAAEAAYWLAKALVQLNQTPAALAKIEQAIQAFPQSSRLPLLTLGRIDALYATPERRKDTVALYAQFAEKYPEHELSGQAAYMAALAALDVGDFAEAHRRATAFLSNEKYRSQTMAPDAMFVAAESLLLPADANDPAAQAAKAEPIYREIVSKYPTHRQAAACRMRIGLCLYMQRKFDAAVSELTQSVAQLNDAALVAEAWLTIGRAHQAAGRLDPAAAAFRQSLGAKPDWPRADEALLALGGALSELKQFDSAAAELTRLMGLEPKSKYRDRALLELGAIAQRQKQYDAAINRFQQLLAEYPQSPLAPRAAYGMGQARFAKQDFEGAVAALSQVTEKFAASEVVPQAKLVRGLARQRLKQFRPAIDDLEAYLAAKPQADEAAEARHALGRCWLELGDPASAAAALKKLVEESPKYPQADQVYYELAFVLADAKQAQAACEAWRALATKFPTSPLAAEAWFRLGESHQASSQWPPAIDAYQKAVQVAKEPALKEKAQFKLGWARLQAGQFPQAAAEFKNQLASFAGGSLAPDAVYFAGESYYRDKKYGPALEQFKRAVEQKHEKYLAQALYRAGDSAAHLSEWAESAAHYRSLLEKFPTFELRSEARYGLGWALQNEEKLDEARQIYEQVAKETETETAAKSRFMIGECDFREKRYEEAIESFLTVALGYPYDEWQGLGYFEAGRCFMELNNTAKAIDMLETVVRKYPKHAKAKDAAGLLDRLKKKAK